MSEETSTPVKKSDTEKEKNDEVAKRYDRQTHVYGKGSLKLIGTSEVLVLGTYGLSVEIIKNLGLQGIKEVTYVDEKERKLTWEDIGTGIVYSSKNFGKSALTEEIRKTINNLNPLIKISYKGVEKLNEVLKWDFTPYKCVVCTNSLDYGLIKKLSEKCCETICSVDKKSVIFIETQIRGLTGRVLVSTGEKDAVKVEEIINDIKPIPPCKGIYSDLITDREVLLNRSYRGLSKFVEEKKRFPVPYDTEDYKKLVELVEQDKGKKINQYTEKFMKTFCYTSSGQLSAMATFFGGMVSNEVMKACLRREERMIPARYFYTFDTINVQENEKNLAKSDFIIDEEKEKNLLRYKGLISVYGKTMFKRISNTKVFLPGMGALGVESVKMLAQYGIKKISTTDFDKIEISNLSRQFLFNNKDAEKGNFKSQAAPYNLMKFLYDDVDRIKVEILKNDADREIQKTKYGEMEITSYQENVLDRVVFSQKFYEEHDITITGFDNVKARSEVAAQCRLYNIPMIDSGIEGLQGITSTHIPNVTGTYTAPSEGGKTFAKCTIASFPTKVEHLVHWALQLFQDICVYEVTGYNALLEDASEENLKKVKYLKKAVMSLEDVVCRSYELFEELFRKRCQDQIDGRVEGEDEKAKVTPTPFDEKNEQHFEFMLKCSKILSQLYDVKDKQKISKEFITKMVSELGNDKMLKHEFPKLEKKLPKINSISFEKDDDLHIGFIALCSSLRQVNYNLQFWGEIDAFEAKKKAALIVPSSQSTSSTAQGLVGLQFLSIITKAKEYRDYKFDLEYNNLFFSIPDNDEKWIDKSVQVDQGRTIEALQTLFKDFLYVMYNTGNKKIRLWHHKYTKNAEVEKKKEVVVLIKELAGTVVDKKKQKFVLLNLVFKHPDPEERKKMKRLVVDVRYYL